VISKPFDPGHEGLINGLSRAQAVMARVMSLSDTEVESVLAETMAAYSNRHDDLRATFRKNFTIVAKPDEGVSNTTSQQRMELIGAYFTQEYSIEAAALFNPSIVEAPDQSDCPPGCLRIILSLRAVGEGHLSSIEFRSGTVHPNDLIVMDPVSPHLSTGERKLLTVEREAHPPRKDWDALTAEEIAADSSYEVSFSSTSVLSERVLFPGSRVENHGLEDARLIRFVDDDGTVCYLGTYTAYDGAHVAPHFLHTDDFVTFTLRPMRGDAAANKGMALFPRRIDGQLWSLSRWDRENISLATFDAEDGWSHAHTVQFPRQPWELVQIGPCSSPIETADGWLVLTHGVGPMRTYAIGALLLDLDDPTRVLGQLPVPLLMAADTERDGYVPNVVYSCGALVHGTSLVLPYGCSDASVRFAFVDLLALLRDLKQPGSISTVKES
jgi:hypothetical protein